MYEGKKTVKNGIFVAKKGIFKVVRWGQVG
jgi:hypothetical protein